MPEPIKPGDRVTTGDIYVGTVLGLAELGRASLANSERWFPKVHARGHDAIVSHLALGIGGEAGEVLDVVKKADVCGGLMDECDMHKPGKHSRRALQDELADLVTYVAIMAEVHGIDLVAAWQAKQAECAERWDEPIPEPPAPETERVPWYRAMGRRHVSGDLLGDIVHAAPTAGPAGMYVEYHLPELGTSCNPVRDPVTGTVEVLIEREGHR